MKILYGIEVQSDSFGFLRTKVAKSVRSVTEIMTKDRTDQGPKWPHTVIGRTVAAGHQASTGGTRIEAPKARESRRQRRRGGGNGEGVSPFSTD